MGSFCPDFFILGAPKCGTTTLAQWMKGLDGIFIPAVKEPNYFNTDEDTYASHSGNEYTNLYMPAQVGQRTGDASPWYLSSSVAVREIVRRNPSAKFIVMIRDHVEMASAMHQQEYVSGNEDCEDFETAWNLQNERLKGKNIPDGCYSEKRLQYYNSCCIGRQIEELSQHVVNENILVISMNALRNNHVEVKKSIMQLLELDSVDEERFPIVNSRKKWASSKWLALSRHVVKIKKCLGIRFSFGLVTRLGQRKTARKELDESFAGIVREQFRTDKVVLDSVISGTLNKQYIS